MSFLCSVLGATTIILMAQDATSMTLLRVYAEFDADPPESVQSAMMEELDSIMEPIGWQISWSRVKEITGGETSGSVAVARFTGLCDVSKISPVAPSDTSLGTTQVSDGDVLPFSHIDCGAIRQFMASELSCMNPHVRRPTFGRALGRVLAHELYHVLTREQRHGKSGIGEARFTPSELIGHSFRFAAPEVRKLRLQLVPVLLSCDLPPADQIEKVSLYISSGCNGCHGRRGEGTRWGPSLQRGKAYDSVTLKQQLSSRTPMYAGAKKMKMLWPKLNPAELQLLSSYLTSLGK